METPAALIKQVLTTVASNEQQIDAILINGDFIKHGVALPQDKYNDTWVHVKAIISEDMQILRTQFPDTLILPTIGNNDVIVHD